MGAGPVLFGCATLPTCYVFTNLEALQGQSFWVFIEAS